ncbi:MAG TPA: energy transducer TonB [Ignavibacteria bacterium]
MKSTFPALRGPLPSSFTDELKAVYQKFMRRAFIGAVIIHIFVIAAYGAYAYYQYLQQEDAKLKTQRIINVTMTDLEPPPSATEEEEPPPPKVEEKITPAKDLEALTPEPVAKEKAEIQTIKTQKELEEIKTPISSTGDTGKFEFSGNIKVEEKKIEEKIEKRERDVEPEKTVYQSFEVEKAPECVNLEQIKSSMNYPSVAIDAGIEGRVTVKVLVNESGNVIKIGSVTGPDVFHDEVRSKVMNLEFTPGLQNGHPVKVWVSVPFTFRLK